MKKTLVVDLNGTSSIYTHYLANGLENHDREVFILGKFKPDFLDVFNITRKYLGLKTGFKLLDYILNWFWLIVNCKNYDTIVIQWLQLLKYTSLEVYLVNFIQKKTDLVYILHNVYPHNNESETIKKRYNLLYKKINKIAVQTSKIKSQLLKITPNKKVIEIEHGLFFKEFRNEKNLDYGNNCLMIGYISRYKGIEDAIQAIRILKNRNFDIELKIIGYGEPEYVKSLNLLIEKNNLQENISIIAKEVSTKFIIDSVKKSSVLLLPYKNISQSGVAYTAIGLAIPFVAYNVGNFKESFGKEKVAEIVSDGNIEEFSNAIEKVLINNIEYKKTIRSKFVTDNWEKNNKIYFE